MKRLKKLLLVLSFVTFFSGVALAAKPNYSATADKKCAYLDNEGPPPEAVVKRTGITREDYFCGLWFPSFNNFTDNKIVPQFKDERNFFRIRRVLNKNNQLKQDSEWKDYYGLLEEGDTVEFITYMHNNAYDDYYFNQESGKGVAKDVKLLMADPFGDGVVFDKDTFKTKVDSSFKVLSLIMASNTIPKVVSDYVELRSLNANSVYLRYLPESVKVVAIQRNVNEVNSPWKVLGCNHPTTDFKQSEAEGKKLVSDGMPFGSAHYEDKVLFNQSVYLGSTCNINAVYWRVKVEKEPEKKIPKVCKSIKPQFKEVLLGGILGQSFYDPGKLVAGRNYEVSFDNNQTLFSDGSKGIDGGMKVDVRIDGLGVMTKKSGPAACTSGIMATQNSLTLNNVPLDCVYNYTPKPKDVISFQVDGFQEGVTSSACKVSGQVFSEVCKKFTPRILGYNADLLKEFDEGKKYFIGADANKDKSFYLGSDGTSYGLENYKISLSFKEWKGQLSLSPQSAGIKGCKVLFFGLGVKPSSPLVLDKLPVNCLYEYVATVGDELTIGADPDDGEKACSRVYKVKALPKKVCKSLDILLFEVDEKGEEKPVNKNAMFSGKTYRVRLDKMNSLFEDGTILDGFAAEIYQAEAVKGVSEGQNKCGNQVLGLSGGVIYKNNPIGCVIEFKATDKTEVKVYSLTNDKQCIKVLEAKKKPEDQVICKKLEVKLFDITEKGKKVAVNLNEVKENRVYSVEFDKSKSLLSNGKSLDAVYVYLNGDGSFENQSGANCPVLNKGVFGFVGKEVPLDCTYKYFPKQGDNLQFGGKPNPTKSKDCIVEVSVLVENVCVGLELKSSSSLEEGKGNKFMVKPEFSGDGKPVELVYEWKAVNKGGGEGGFSKVGENKFENPKTIFEKEVDYNGGAGGTVITVQAKNKVTEEEYPRCKKELKVPEGPGVPNVCVGLELKSSSSLEEGKGNKFMVKPKFSGDGKPVELVYEWKAVNKGGGEGGFSKVGENKFENPKKIFEEEVDYNGGAGGTVITVQAKNKVTGEEYPRCKKELKVPEGPGVPNVCVGLELKSSSSLEEGKGNKFMVKPKFSGDGKPVELVYEWKAVNKGGGEGGFSKVGENKFENPKKIFEEEVDYNGGAGGTVITVQAKNKVTGEEYSRCKKELKVPEGVKICKKFAALIKDGAGNQVKELKEGESYVVTMDGENSIFNDNPPTKLSKFDLELLNPNGVGQIALDGDECPAVLGSGNKVTVSGAQSGCEYSYTAKSGDVLVVKSTVADNPNDDSNCKEVFAIKDVEKPRICKALNLSYGGVITSKPVIKVGSQSALISVSPVTDKGEVIPVVEWSRSGGLFIAHEANNVLCKSPAGENSFTTFSFCKYYFFAQNLTDGFEVKVVSPQNLVNGLEVTDEAGVCKVKSTSFLPPPPPSENKCLGLTVYLDNLTDFGLRKNTNWVAKAQLSNGEAAQVVFQTLDGQGLFGLGNLKGNPFEVWTSLPSQNTPVVGYEPNVSLFSVVRVYVKGFENELACNKYFTPVAPPLEKCIPPKIVKSGEDYKVLNPQKGHNYCWFIDGGVFSNNSSSVLGAEQVSIKSSNGNYKLRVEDCAPQYKNICFDEVMIRTTPSIDKEVRLGSGVYKKRVAVSYAEKNMPELGFRISFEPNSDSLSNNKKMNVLMNVLIKDEQIKNEKIVGKKRRADGISKDGGNLNINTATLVVKQGGESLAVCKGNNVNDWLGNDVCYVVNWSDGKNFMNIYNISSNEGITIEFSGDLESEVDCENGEYCDERYLNQAYVTNVQYCNLDDIGGWQCDGYLNKVNNSYCVDLYDNDLKVVGRDCDESLMTVASRPVYAEVSCPYLLTRASGDVLLEKELKYGVDISKCYPYKNVTSTVIKPVEKPVTITKTGQGGVKTFVVSNEICKSEVGSEMGSVSGSGVAERLSSQVCELAVLPGVVLDKENLKGGILMAVERLIAGVEKENVKVLNKDDSLVGKEVVYFEGDVTLNGLDYVDGSGAKTVVVKNGDLKILGDVKYSVGNQPVSKRADLASLASLAFIVINGNIQVSSEVSQLSGVYFVTGDGEKTGKFKSVDDKQSTKLLVIDGSVYGDVGPLFSSRLGAGNPDTGEGAVTIRYDQRVFENTPPGLGSLIY